MPCLNADILFDTAKKFIDKKDADSLVRFAFSGREPLKEVKKCFSAVKSLELHWNHFIVEWNRKCVTFRFDNKAENDHLKVLLSCIGDDLKNLFLDHNEPVYKLIIDKIMAKKKLSSFCVGSYRNVTFLNNFFLELFSSLKIVTIPSYCMTPIFRDFLNLDSLTVLDVMGDNFALFCCKTPSLIFSRNRHSSIPFLFKDMYPKYGKISPHISAVKCITVNYLNINFNAEEFEEMVKYYSSLRILQFNFLMDNIKVNLDLHVPCMVTSFNKLVKEVSVLPPRLILIFLKSNITVTFDKLLHHVIWTGFKFNGSDSNFYSYIIAIPFPTGNIDSTIFEVRLAK